MSHRKEALALLETLPSHVMQDALFLLQGLKRSTDCLIVDRLGHVLQDIFPFIETTFLKCVSCASRDFRRMASMVLSKRHVLLTRALMGTPSERFSIFRMKSNDWTGHNPLFRIVWSFILTLRKGVSSGSARFYEDAAALLAHGADPNARLAIFERSAIECISRANACRYCGDALAKNSIRWEINQVSLFETLVAYATYADYAVVGSMRSLFEKFGGRLERELPTEAAMLRCGMVLPEVCPFFHEVPEIYDLKGASEEAAEEEAGEDEESEMFFFEDGGLTEVGWSRAQRELPMWWLQDEMERRRQNREESESD